MDEYQYGIIWLVSIQIAVRLPDDMVEFVDRLVAEGQADEPGLGDRTGPGPGIPPLIAARDAAILAEAGADTDMDNLADYAARAPLDVN